MQLAASQESLAHLEEGNMENREGHCSPQPASGSQALVCSYEVRGALTDS